MNVNFNLRVKVIILLLIFLGIFWLSTICGCTQGGAYGLYEGVTTMASTASKAVIAKGSSAKVSGSGKPTLPSASKLAKGSSKKEGFGTALSEAHTVDTSRWSNPALGASPTKAGNSEANPQLASGELDFFENTEFKPECCPTTYSNSMGCACISQNQYQYLITRGGNNVPFSQY
jgi:hypothetical protein